MLKSIGSQGCWRSVGQAMWTGIAEHRYEQGILRAESEH